MIIKGVDAKSILNSRKEKTIQIFIKTDFGNFSASAPQGKSTGRHEAKPYRKSLEEDIKTIKKFSDYFSEEILEGFDDLKRIEDIVEGHIGANTLFAIESAALKALAHEMKKEIWELINPNARKFPRLVGNCIGGGKHSKLINNKKPDFQEFLLIPNMKGVKENLEKNKKLKEDIKYLLKNKDDKFKGEKIDEDACSASLNEKEVFDALKKLEVPIGTDVAASSFFEDGSYNVGGKIMSKDNLLSYYEQLTVDYQLFSIEDPFAEEDWESFQKVVESLGDKIWIIGDDLLVSNNMRIEEFISILQNWYMRECK